MSRKTPEEQAAAAFPIINEGMLSGRDIADNCRRREAYATCIREKVEPLEQWKESAIKVMGDWDKVHEALGKPGKLGESMAAASLAEVVKLRVLVQELVNASDKVKHWHDAHDGGMIVSGDSVRGLWRAQDHAKELGFVPTKP